MTDHPEDSIGDRGPLPLDRVRPDRSRLSLSHPVYAAIIECHEAALHRGDGAYRDPATGLSVFTAKTLWDRGWCCDSGCRHCPFMERDGST